MDHLQLRHRARREEQTNDDLSGRLVTLTNPDGAASEAYRTLRTNLLYALVDDPPKAIVVTSPGPTEGKSTTCANLSVALAQTGKNVLLLDCDFRKPVLHKIFGLRNLRGLVNVLVRERTLQETWQEPLPGLKVVVAGLTPPNPAELLGSERLMELLNEARQEFDYVLMDVPPAQLVSDPIILSAQGDGVLLVIDAQNTRKGSVRHSVRSLEAVGANVLGTVMNNAEPPRGSYYNYSYTRK